MEPDFLVNEGDFGYALTHICKDTDGEPVDLSTATSIRFRMCSISAGAEAVIDAVADNHDDSNGTRGEVSYTLVEGDTDLAGVYVANFVAFFADSERAFPVNRRLQLLVNQVPRPVS